MTGKGGGHPLGMRPRSSLACHVAQPALIASYKKGRREMTSHRANVTRLSPGFLSMGFAERGRSEAPGGVVVHTCLQLPKSRCSLSGSWFPRLPPRIVYLGRLVAAVPRSVISPLIGCTCRRGIRRGRIDARAHSECSLTTARAHVNNSLLCRLPGLSAGGLPSET